MLQAEIFFGDYYYDELNYDEAFSHLKRAEKYIGGVKDILNVVQLYNLIGIYHSLKSNYITAIDYFYKVLEYLPLLPEEKRDAAKVNVNMNIASIFNGVEDVEAAIAYEKEGLEHLKKENPKYDHSNYAITSNIAVLYMAMKNYGEAWKYWEKAHKMSEKLGDNTEDMTYPVSILTMQYRENQQEELYEKVISMMMKIIKKEEIQFEEYVALEILHSFFIEFQDEEAFEIAGKEIISYQEQNYWAGKKLKILEEKIDFYESMGDMEKYQQTCVEFYNTQKQLDQEEKLEKSKSLDSYIKIKEEEISLIELKRHNEELKKKSHYDQMTGLPNRYLLNEFCEKAFEEAKKRHTPVSVEVIDVDHFKQFNDNYGHLEGDKCLIAIAGQIAKTVTEGDLCARYGGDEFIIVRIDKPAEMLERDAFDLRKRIMDLGIPHAFSSAAAVATISQGIVNKIPSRQEGVKEFIKIADEALYEAKKTSKNTVVLKVD